ncbi:t-SNARE [Linderina pennispora]|uniref:t-SNARE n=1 Tax=Linderina pennispora TaxID=61395 RepID=A0A1Y1W644_9FUNG|nr:t-SNARE [Linderina pennispora]ORX69007.1 t-SNARE [Linderina pennispora]
MSDPFVIVQDDVVSAFGQIKSLFAAWKRLSGKRRSQQEENEFQFTTDELYSTISSISTDLEDLQETINVARGSPEEYGLTPAQIKDRQAFQQEQQMIINQQDQHLDSMLDTVRNLHGIAGTMNTELDDQAILLDEMGDLVERTQSKIDVARKKVNEFLRDKSNRSLRAILILFLVILVLLVLIIFT